MDQIIKELEFLLEIDGEKIKTNDMVQVIKRIIIRIKEEK